MKTLSLILCMLLVCIGFYFAIFSAKFFEGSLLMCFGALCFLLISKATEKIQGYDPNSFMNK